MNTLRTRPLGRTGLVVPELALGAAPFGDVYGQMTQEAATATIDLAFSHGVTLVDTSPHYGDTRSETVLGRALAGRDRSSYTLITKTGRYGDRGWDFSADRTKRSVHESLERLGVDYVDVMQCHDVEWGDRDQLLNEALPVLRAFRDEGLLRHIGITGYTLDVLVPLAIEQEVDTVMTYCEYNLQDRRLAQAAQTLAQHGIGVLNASPLHMGALTTRGAPVWHPGHPEVLAATRRVAKLCAAAGTTIEAVAMQFALDLPENSAITTTVVGCSSPDDVALNIAACGTPPDPDLLAAITAEFGPLLDIGWETPLPVSTEATVSA